jgi:hypothetical protein
MKKDRQYKIDLIKGLMTGARSVNEVDSPEFVVLFPASPPPAGVKTPPPPGADYFELLTKSYLSEKELSELRTKYPAVTSIYINYDPV